MATKPPCASHATALQQRAFRQYPHADNGPLPSSLPPPRTKAPAPGPALPCPRIPPGRGAGFMLPVLRDPRVPGGCGGTHRCRRAVMLSPAARCCRRSARQYKGRSLAGRFYPRAYANDGDVTTNHFAAFRVSLSLFFFPPLLPSPPFIAQPSSPRTRVHAHKATHTHTDTHRDRHAHTHTRHKHSFQLGS